MSLVDASVLNSSSTQALPEYDDQFPPSFAQQRLWLLVQMDGVSEAYHIPLGLRLTGDLDRVALHRALDRIIVRHEALRTTFALDNGDLVQRIAAVERSRFLLIEHDLRLHSNPQSELDRLAQLESGAPFDLAAGPLIRGRLVRVAPDEHVLLITMHHIVSDGWSLGLLVKELNALYAALLRGEDDPLPELDIQYADYSVWQRRSIEGEIQQQQGAYWKEALAGAPALLELPTDRPRPAEQSYPGSFAELVLDEELTAGLKDLSRRHGVTLFMTLLAGWSVLLARLSGQQDVLVGTPTANRGRAEIENLIGFFVNTLVVRLDLSNSPSVREVLQQTRERTIAAQQNQDLPFEQVVETAQPVRSLAHSPLFQVMFAWQGNAQERFEFAGLEVQSLPSPHRVAKYDLLLELWESDNHITGGLEFATALFEQATIERYLGYFRNLLRAMVADDAQAIDRLPMLPDSDRSHLLREFNNSEAEYPKDIPLAKLVEQQVERTPNAVAVVFDKQHLTYRDLNARANQLAHELIKRGVGPDQIVGLYVSRSTDLIVALLAIIKAGAAYLPLDPLFPPERLGYMLSDSGAPLLITEKSLRGTLPPFAGTILQLEDEAWQTNSRENPSVAVKPEDLGYVIYTSGSTGKPKGVQLPRMALTNLLWSMREWLKLTDRDRLLAVTTISFDIASADVWLPLLVGAQTVLASFEEAADGNALKDLLQKHDITFLQATPVTWRLLFDAGWRGKSNLQTVCTGEAMPQEVAVQLVPVVKLVWNLYGPTETTIWSTGYRVTDGREPILIGRPVFNTQCYILDAHGQPVPAGVTGELFIAGDGLARGYLNRPELTAEKFIADPFAGGEARMYRTGDLARYRPDGNIECLGRIDHQVKIRGYRIELGEIEARLAEYPGVREAVVIAREDTPGDKRLVAYYAASAQAGSDESNFGTPQFRAYLTASLPDYMVPAVYVRMEALPLTPNGKIDRKVLPPPVADSALSHSFEPPQGETELKLAAIWSDVLKLDRIDRNESFFDLGGHSLMAARAVATMNQEFGTSLPIRVLFQANTVSQLASLIEKQAETQADFWHPVIPIQTRGTRCPLFCVARPNVNALGYLTLSRELGNEQPVYGLQVQLEEDPSIDFTDEQIRNTAAEYVRAVRTVQAHGPYILIGQCQGSFIAFEMVRQLEAEGENVAFFGVLDAWPEENTRHRWRFQTYLAIKRLQALDRQTIAKAISRVNARFADRKTPQSPAISPQALSPSSKKVLFQKYFPGKDFVPPVCSAPITVFRIGEQPWYRKNDETMGWGVRTRSSVKISNISGHHLTILRQPNVKQLATLLTKHLDESAPGIQKELCESLAASTEPRSPRVNSTRETADTRS